MSHSAYDILAIDVDGTLLDSAGNVSPRNAEAVQLALDHGVYVLIATARPPRAIASIAAQLHLDKPTPRADSVHPWPAVSINYNGAVLWNLLTQQAIGHTPLDRSIAQSVIAAARSIDPDILVVIEHLDRWYTDRDDEAIREDIDTRDEPGFIGPITSFMHIEPSKLVLLASAESLTTVRRLVMDDYVSDGHVSCRATGPDRLEVQAAGVDKAETLSELAASLRVPMSRICAVGDGPNDAGMLRAAGMGLAVANAWGEARAAADHILTADSDHDPIAEVVQRFVLIGD